MADVAPHNMTTNTDPSPYVAAANSEFGGVYKAYRAFNGYASGEDVWITATENTGWVSIDLGSGNAHIVGTYEVRGGATPNRSPQDWTLQGSNNGSDWTTIDTVTGQTAWSAGQLRAFTCDVTTTPYRYFKIVITANNGGALVAIGELYLYEATNLSRRRRLLTGSN